MKCPKCQFENPDEAKFCAECGSPIEFHCPECGAKTLATGKFCIGCGHDLTAPTKPAPADLSFDEKIAKIQRYLPEGLTEKILSVQVAQTARFVSGEMFGRTMLGEGYLLAGEFQKARETLGTALELAERCEAKRYRGHAHGLLGEVALKTNPDEAPPHFEKAIQIYEEIKFHNELALAYSGMGRYHKQQGNTEQAREYLTKALEIFERPGTLIEPDKVREELAGLPQ